MQPQGYADKKGAENGIASAAKNGGDEANFEKKESSNDQGTYISGRPIQKESPVAAGLRETLSLRYNVQFFKDLQINFVTSYSISFIPGTTSEKASFKNLRFATVVIP